MQSIWHTTSQYTFGWFAMIHRITLELKNGVACYRPYYVLWVELGLVWKFSTLTNPQSRCPISWNSSAWPST